MPPNSHSHPSELDRDLEILAKLRENIANLVNLYLEQQTAVLKKSPGAERAVLIVGLLRAGARMRWGLHGWEIVGSGLPVPADIVRGLCDTELIESEDGFAVWSARVLADQVAEERSDLFESLLSPRTSDLDRLSSAILRWQQEIALFKRIHQLCLLRRELRDELHHEADYWATARSSLRWWRSIARLTVAVSLNLFTAGELKLRMARRSLIAMKQIAPSLFD